MELTPVRGVRLSPAAFACIGRLNGIPMPSVKTPLGVIARPPPKNPTGAASNRSHKSHRSHQVPSATGCPFHHLSPPTRVRVPPANLAPFAPLLACGSLYRHLLWPSV